MRRPLLVGLMVMAAATRATAQPQVPAEPNADDKALATVLFHQGRALMGEGRIPDACQKLEESQRLDPGGGTILNLALCHEREGRLARSWGEFKEAVLVARRDGRRDRETEAAEHVRQLEPRLSRLTIAVPPETQVDSLVIERDGLVLGRGAWSTAIPIDGGEHVVRATALGRDPFTTTVVISTESDAQTVQIPVLATPVVVVTTPRASAALIAPAPPPASPTAAWRRWVAIGTAGTGVVLLGTAGYALSTALAAKHAATPDCFTDGCNPTGVQNRHKATSRGNLATVLGSGGAVLVGAGATLFFLERRSARPTQETRTALRFTVGGTPGCLVGAIDGRF